MREFIGRSVDRAKDDGTYYGYHARHAMYTCRMLSATSSEASALAWGEAMLFLCAYGHHKDYTIFEILESIPALLHSSRGAAIDAIAKSQTMAEALESHTDGRGTGHAVIAWFRGLAAVDLPLAIEIVANARRKTSGAISWRVGKATRICLEQAEKSASLAISAWCWGIVPFDPADDSEGLDLAKRKVESAFDLMSRNDRAGSTVFQLVSAQIANDAHSYDTQAIRWLAERGAKPTRDMVVPSPSRSGADGASTSNEEPSLSFWLQRQFPQPFFPAGDSTIRETFRGVQEWNERSFSQRTESEWAAFINSFGYRLVELLAQHGEVVAVRLLKELVRGGFWISSEDHPLASIAEGLLRLGISNLAAAAYALAYARTRGEDGWSPMGGSHEEHLLLKAVDIDQQIALSTLALEVVEIIGEHPAGIGLTKNLIRRMTALREADLARRMWWAAYDVIERRVPLRAASPEVFPEVSPGATAHWTLDEGLAAIVLAEFNHPVISRKLQAALAVRELLPIEGAAFESPLRWFCATDCPTSSMILLLQTLEALSTNGLTLGPEITNALRECSVGSSWIGRSVARRILSRCETLVGEPVFESLVVRQIRVPEDTRLRFKRGLTDGMRKVLNRLPGSEDWLCDRFVQVIESDESRAEADLRYRLARGDRGRSVPITPVLFWEQEVLLRLMDEMLNHLKPRLLITGAWNAEAEADAVTALSPNLNSHLACLASRRPRPRRSIPDVAGWSVGEVPKITADQDVEGWHIIGYLERYWVPGETYLQSPGAIRIAYSASVIRTGNENIASGTFPFGAMDKLGRLPPRAFAPGLSGPLCVIHHITDWLSDSTLLIIAPGLASRLGLQSTVDQQGIQWRNRSGELQALFRSWFVRDRHQFEASPARAVGAELLISPSVFSGIGRIFGGVVCQINGVDELGIDNGSTPP